MRKIWLCMLCVFIFPAFMYGANHSSFTQGKQYKKISPNLAIPYRFQLSKNKILVVEFFSYGCPWCFQLEPALETWLKTKPAYVKFERIPVVFESGWQVYAKAFYVAKALGILDKMTPAIFNAIHKQGLNLASEQAMKQFFVKHGVSPKAFDNAYNLSPSLQLQLNRDKNLMLAYKVYYIPTVVVNGKYMVDPSLTKGDDKLLMKVVNFLVRKERQQQIATKQK